jgi:hypothetical protein
MSVKLSCVLPDSEKVEFSCWCSFFSWGWRSAREKVVFFLDLLSTGVAEFPERCGV